MFSGAYKKEGRKAPLAQIDNARKRMRKAKGERVKKDDLDELIESNIARVSRFAAAVGARFDLLSETL